MRKYIRFLTISFIIVAFLCLSLYLALTHFETKVKEDYTRLMLHSQKMLQVFLDKKSADLYMLCLLDYHINPNGKDMLLQCGEIEGINKSHPQLNTKIETPYYDFYIKYMQGILQ